MEEFLNPSERECEKYPGHEQFTATSYFDPSHLPQRYQSLMAWALCLHKARLTVKLKVNHISPDRPVKFRVKNSVRGMGSGHVTGIERNDHDGLNITIEVAAHTVFSKQEAASTKAQFYYHLSKVVFELENPKMLHVNTPMDVRRIVYTIDNETMKDLFPGNDLPALKYALSPSGLPDVNSHMNISLLQTVVARYKTSSFRWLSFLFHEIRCLKNIKFVSNTNRVLEIEIDNSPRLLYDVILLIIAVKLHRDDIMNLMEDIIRWDHIHMETAQRPFITVKKEVRRNDGHMAKSTSKLSLNRFIKMDNEPICIVNSDFRIQQNVALYTLMECFTVSPVGITELKRALTEFCQFDISARLHKTNIVVEIPVTPVRDPGRMSLEVNLHDVKVEEGDDHIAVLISHPHDMPQQITTGEVKLLDGQKIEHTAPSCPGSAGGQVLAIPKEITSLAEIENIGVFTHSHVSGTPEKGVGHRL